MWDVGIAWSDQASWAKASLGAGVAEKNDSELGSIDQRVVWIGARKERVVWIGARKELDGRRDTLDKSNRSGRWHGETEE